MTQGRGVSSGALWLRCRYYCCWLACWATVPNSWVPIQPSQIFPKFSSNQAFSVGGGLILSGTALLAGVFLKYQRPFWLWLVMVLGFLTFLAATVQPLLFLLDSQRQLPLRQLAQVITQVQRPAEPLVMVGFKKPSLVFYTQQPVKYISSNKGAIRYLGQIVGQSTPTTVLILSQPQRFAAMGLQTGHYQTLGHAGGYQLIRVFLKALPGNVNPGSPVSPSH
ncbi:hypothetical protein [Neosynechococcus sphagnicola]|uniref:hypothetical protein n=1 Tax=Neosynechococcus sphagnicola TaxID=1501145 RepID=UPI0019552988|nr:hypothetical protein [Neosynechococcus sphagnicola]